MVFTFQVALVSKSIECLSSALSQCLSKWRRLGSSQGSKAITPLLQLVCCSTLQLAHSLSTLLQHVSLSEKVCGIKFVITINFTCICIALSQLCFSACNIEKVGIRL